MGRCVEGQDVDLGHYYDDMLTVAFRGKKCTLGFTYNMYHEHFNDTRRQAEAEAETEAKKRSEDGHVFSAWLAK